ncbi:MAG TPA: hypothetical protein VFU26_15175 [Gaiellaceae bacterium]|nr:hypothetical protein [Gaiellaceae bacterium]
MKKFGLYLVTLAALVGAGVAYSAVSPSTKLQKQDRVYGGGQFGPGCFSNSTLCFANPRNFAVDAHAEGDGSETAGNSTYGTPGFTENFRSVRCLRVEGNRAVIGGVIESGANAGFGYVEYFVDRGGPGLGDRDLASPSLLDPLDSLGWPAGFPSTCPSPTSGWPAAGPPVYLEVDEGDIVVQDAPSD